MDYDVPFVEISYGYFYGSISLETNLKINLVFVANFWPDITKVSS